MLILIFRKSERQKVNKEDIYFNGKIKNFIIRLFVQLSSIMNDILFYKDME